MLRNYLKTTWRSLLRNRSYALINLTGLALGLGVAIVLFWIVRFEYSFDRYHHNSDRLYRLINKDKYGEKGSHIPQGVVKALNEQIPGVDAAASSYAALLSVNKQRMNEIGVCKVGMYLSCKISIND